MASNDPHGPNRISNYINTHETITEQFVSRGFIALNELVIEAYGNQHLTITGSLHCLGGIIIDVAKILQIVDEQGGEARVKTVWYRYHAKIQGVGNVLRYDSPHAHRNFDHVHRFDVFGDGSETVEESNWPHLGRCCATNGRLLLGTLREVARQDRYERKDSRREPSQEEFLRGT